MPKEMHEDTQWVVTLRATVSFDVQVGAPTKSDARWDAIRCAADNLAVTWLGEPLQDGEEPEISYVSAELVEP